MERENGIKMGKKYLIIGGVAGGATAATRLRRLNEDDEIILFEKGEYISFANCGLPYHVGGVIKERDDLLLQTVEGMNKQYGLDVRNFSEVTAINPTEKSVSVLNHQTGESYQETFDKLIISTGAKAIVPPIEGLDNAKNVFSLRNIPDMDVIEAFIQQHKVQTATVIGGGFIGLEMMENLVELGIKVQLVEMAPQVMPNIDFEMAQMLHAQINMQGAIKVNKQLETSFQDIYAIGDVIEVADAVNGHPTNIPLAWPANRQGRLVADIINGIPAAYTGTQGTSVAKVFELTAAGTGNSERLLQHHGIEYHAVHIHPNSHAGYYPGAAPIALKLLFAPDGKILGAQAVGTEGVEKRIDVISTAMRFGAKAAELASIELAYAPPYSSAKDPVNMLGYTVDNMINDKVRTFQWSEVDELLAAGAYFLDVREDFELATGALENSIQIPLNQIRDRLSEIPRNQTIYVYCQVGHRGYNAARILMQAGYEVKNLDGGYKTYKHATYELRQIDIKPTDTALKKTDTPPSTSDVIEVDACGLQCPGPILKVKESMDKMQEGQRLEIQASDFGFSTDVEAWAKNTGNTVLENKIQGNKVVATLVKGSHEAVVKSPTLPTQGVLTETKDGATMVIFSGDLDKALASMIIATGAAAYGKNVTLFFTFWGLSVLKKKKVKKSGMAKMFDMMLPSGADKLKISKMNMGGMGTGMIKSIMKQKNVDSLPDLIEQAHNLGVKFVACTMSMDLMEIEKEELYDFVEYGGVATFIGDSEKANMQLFI